MAKPFDSTTKQLIEAHPADWLAYAGLPVSGPIQIVDADISSFTAAADKVIRVEGPKPYIAHMELQAGADTELDRRVLLYNVLLGWRHKLPVRSVVVLLRPAAAAAGVSGGFTDVANSGSRLEFRYKLIRIWEQSAESLLAGGLGILPLAPLGAVKPDEVPAILEGIEDRLAREAPDDYQELEVATYILMGLRYPREMITHLLNRARHMKESVTYQLIFEEGEAHGEARGEAIGRARGEALGQARGEQNLLLRIATKKLGPPAPHHLAAIRAISEIERLESLGDRLLEVDSWDALLADLPH